MPVEFTEYDDGKSIEVTASGKLTAEDYQIFIPRFEALIERFEDINILFVMRDFSGFEMWALWEDIKFEWEHYSDIGRLGMAGEGDWQEWMAMFCKPFTKSAVKYFDLNDIEDAREWFRRESSDEEE